MTVLQAYEEVPLPMVYPSGLWGFVAAQGVTNPSSTAWESNNLAVYYPISVPTVCVARRVWWANGATVNAANNVDAGIYRDGGYKPGVLLIAAGSTAQGTANQVQFADVTDTTLTPGLYWLALACSTTSATFFSVAQNTYSDAYSRFQQATAMPLPASATVAESSGTNIWFFGFSTTTIT